VQDKHAQSGNNGLSVIAAILLLVVVTVPVISSNLNPLLSSDFRFQVDTQSPACLSGGLCFRFLNNSVEHTTSGYGIALRIEGASNVYELRKDLSAGTLRVVLANESMKDMRVEIAPHYNLYHNTDEVSHHVPASLQFQEAPPVGRLTLAFQRADAISEYRVLDIAPRDKRALAFSGVAEQRAQFQIGAGLLILLIVSVTCLVETRTTSGNVLDRGAFAYAIVARWAAVVAAERFLSPIWPKN